MRDKGSSGFLLPVNEIQPTVEETYAGVVAMANEIYKEFQFGTSTQQTTTKEQTTSKPTTPTPKEQETTTSKGETITSEIETTETQTMMKPTTVKAKEPETATSGVETTTTKIGITEMQTTKSQMRTITTKEPEVETTTNES